MFSIKKISSFLFLISLFAFQTSLSQSISTISPKNNQLISDSSVLFNWNKVPAYNNYQLEISYDQNFSVYTFVSNKVNYDTLTYLFNSFGIYYWRVKGFNLTNDSIISAVCNIELFSPKDIPGLQIWLNPDKNVTSINNKVTEWKDYGGQNRLALQIDTSKSPGLNSNGLNGHSTILFDGVNDVLGFQDSITISAAFVFSSWNGTNLTFPSYYTLLSPSSPSGGSQIFVSKLGTSEIYQGGFFGTSLLINDIFSMDYAPLNSYKVISAFKSTPITYTNPQLLKIGHDNYYDPWKGFISEILLYNNSSLNLSQVNKINTYLFDKYSPPVNLGSDIRIIYGFCDTVISAYKPWFISYVWKKIGSLNILSTDSVCSVNSTGKYSVTTIDLFNRISTDTIDVIFPNPNLNINDTTVCLNNSLHIISNLSSISGYSFLWSDNSTLNYLDITTASTVNVTISDSLGCSIISNSVSVLVDSFANKISLGPDISLCSGNSISLIQYPENPESLQFLWSDLSTDSLLVVNNSDTFSISVSNQSGCVGYDTIFVTVIGAAPIVLFSVDSNCLGLPTHINNLSSLTYDSLLWVFEDGYTDTAWTPNHTFTSTGLFDITLTIYSNSCFNSYINQVDINSNPVANFSYTNSCVGYPVEFNNLSLENGGGTIINYEWDFSIYGNSNASDTNFTFPVSGNIPVSLSITALNGCTDSITKIINTVTSTTLPITSLIQPNNLSYLLTNNITFKWNTNNSIKNILEISIDNFNTILYSDTNILNQSSASLSLSSNQIVYWRVKSYNYCYEETISDVWSFIYISPPSFTDVNLWIDAGSNVNIDTINNFCSVKNLVNLNDTSFQTVINQFPGLISNNSLINNQASLSFDGINDILLNSNNHLIGAAYIISRWLDTDSIFPDYNGLLAANNTSTPYPYIFIGNKNTSEIYYSPPWYNEVYINTVQSKDYSPLNKFKILYGETINPEQLTGFVIGSAANTWGYWKGEIAEIIIFNQKPSDSIKTIFTNYFRNKYTPNINLGNDISISYGFCDTSVYAYKPWFTSFLWKKNGSTDTLSTDSLISVNSSGNYKVTVTDIFGFTSTDSINIIFNSPQPNMIPDTAYCLGSSLEWNTGLDKTSYSFLWQDNSTDSLLIINQPGEYSVQITDSFGCKFYSDTIAVSVDSFQVTITLGADTTSLCSGNTISLQSGTEQVNQYLWNDNSTNPSLVINSSGNYWVSVTNIHGCSAVDTIHVNVHGVAPMPAFSYGNTCYGNPITFTDNSQTLDGSNIISWQWITLTDTLYDQDITLTLDTLISFNLQLIISTDSLCSNSVIENITINPNPIANFSVEGTCEGSITNFTLLGSGLLTDWNWSFGDNTSSTDYHTQHLYNGVGDYPVSLHIINNFGCEDSITKTVQIKLSPIAGFDFSPACTGNLTWFFDTSIVSPVFPILNRSWDFGDGTTSIQQNPSHTYATVGQYDVNMYIHSLNGCSSSTIHTINVSAKPLAGFLGDSTCVGVPITFTDTSYTINDTIYKWKWLFGNNTSSTLQNPSAYYLTEGNYLVNLEVTSEVDCKDTTSKVIRVHPLPEIDFYITPTFGPPGVQIFTHNNSSSGQNLWYFGDGQTSNLMNPIHVYSDTGNYTIWLKVINEHGCFDSTYSTIKVIPNIYDLAVVDISTTQNNEFITVTVSLANVGTMPIINPSLVLSSDVHTPVMEVYNDTIVSGQIIVNYQLNSQLPISNQYLPKYICVKGLLASGQTDIDLSNNESCQVLGDNNFVLNLYPNPTSENINVDLSITIPGKSTLEIFDKTGRIVTRQEYELQTGFNRLIIDVKDYAKGKYNINLKAPEGTESLEFVKY